MTSEWPLQHAAVIPAHGLGEVIHAVETSVQSVFRSLIFTCLNDLHNWLVTPANDWLLHPRPHVDQALLQIVYVSYWRMTHFLLHFPHFPFVDRVQIHTVWEPQFGTNKNQCLTSHSNHATCVSPLRGHMILHSLIYLESMARNIFCIQCGKLRGNYDQNLKFCWLLLVIHSNK